MASTSLVEQLPKTQVLCFVGLQDAFHWTRTALRGVFSVKFLLLSLTVCVVLFNYQLGQFYRNYGGKPGFTVAHSITVSLGPRSYALWARGGGMAHIECGRAVVLFARAYIRTAF